MAGAMKVIDLGSLGDGGVEIDGFRAGVEQGGVITAIGDVNGDGRADFSVTSGYYNSKIASFDMVFFGASNLAPVLDTSMCDGVQGFTVTPEHHFPTKVTPLMAAGDLNGDGVDDFGLGTYLNQYHPAMAIYGDADRQSAQVELPTEDGPEGVLFHAAQYVAAGDVNGDGFDDILTTTTIDDYGTKRVVLELGGPTGTLTEAEITRSSGSYFGTFIGSVGDINGDGFDDFGVHAATPGFTLAEYVIFGHADFGPVDLATLTPDQGFLQRGPVSAAGDVNGDGFGDYIAHEAVIFGHDGPFTDVEPDAVDGSDGFRLKLGDTFKWASMVGDFNGDGFDDVACYDALDSAGGDEAGAVYVVFGHADGFHSVVQMDNLKSSTGVKIIGPDAGDHIGVVAALGDVNGDGVDDIGISDPSHGDTGAAYVVYGLLPETAVKRVGTVAGQSISGGDLNDKLFGMGGNDALWGHAGKDLLDGGDGDDVLRAGDGKDVLKGGAGDDTLIGGQGHDRLTGGEGADVFSFLTANSSPAKAADIILDLGADDWIDLSQIDADTGTAGDQAFVKVSHFNGHAGQLVVTYDAESDTTLLQADVDGDRKADFALHILGDASHFTGFVL